MPLFSVGIVYHFACAVPGTQRVKKSSRDKAFFCPYLLGSVSQITAVSAAGRIFKYQRMTPSDIPQAKLVYMLM